MSVEPGALDYARMVLAEAPDAAIVTSLDGRVQFCNAGAEAMFGFEKGELIGAELETCIVPAGRMPDARSALQRVLDVGLHTYETIRRRRDGSLLCVDVTAKLLRDEAGLPRAVLFTKKDVTDLKVRREAKLVGARFRDLLETMPDAIVMVNALGRIVMANGQAERLFGYGPRELTGMPVEALLPQRFRAQHVAHRAMFLDQPRARAMGTGFELFGLRKDGVEFPVEISLSPLETDEGVLVSSAIRDISERKRVERELQQKNAQLASAMRAKDTFLATMSHELRTPLNGVIGYTGTLLMRLAGPLTPDQESQLRTVRASAEHLLALINGLLDLAKIEAGKVELSAESLELAALIGEVLDAVRPQAEAKGLVLDARLPRQPVLVRSDRQAVRQILLNLVGNALKFTERGQVRVGIDVADGRGPRVVVEDSGVGIHPDDVPRLFEAFSRVGRDCARRPEGSGLGLHVSAKLAELLGARITCRSEQGVGSTFALEFDEI